MFRNTLSAIAILALLSPAFAGSATPSSALQAYIKTAASATSWGQLTPLMSSRAIIEMKGVSDDQLKGMLGFVSGVRADQTKFEIIVEDVNGNNATIHATGCIGGKAFVETVILAKEEGAWKVGKSLMSQDGSKC